MCARPLALWALLVALALATAQGAADDEAAPKYPAIGSVVPGPFNVLNLNGDRKGRYHCLICRFSTRPVACVLARLRVDLNDDGLAKGLAKLDKDQPLWKLMQRLDQIVDKNTDAHMGAFYIFFGLHSRDEKADDPAQKPRDDLTPLATRLLGDETVKEVVPIVKEAGLKGSIFAWGGEAMPKDYLLPDDGPFLKVLLYNNYRVVHYKDFKDQPPTDKDVDGIAAEFSKLVPPPFINRKTGK